MPRSRQISFERSSLARAVREVAQSCVDVGAAEERIRLDEPGRPRSRAQASSSSRNACTSARGVCPNSIEPPTSFHAAIWRRTSPEAIACSRPRCSASSCALRLAGQQLRSSHQLPRVGEVGIVVEGRNRSLGDGTELVGVGRSSHVVEVAALERGADLRALVAERARLFDGLRREPLRRLEESPLRGVLARAPAGAPRARPARTPGAALARWNSEAAAAASPRSSARSPARRSSRAALSARSSSRRPSSAPSRCASSRW